MLNHESYQLNLGVLRSQMALQLHTRQAARLWYGRKHEDGNRHGILGLSGFLTLANRITIGSRQDDPYSDWFMLRLEEKIDETNTKLKMLKDEVNEVFVSVPSSFTLTENLNIQPVNLPVFAGSHLGYLAIYALAQYDEIVRKVMLAHHIALIHHATIDTWLERGDRYMRSLFALVQLYRFSGTTRKDHQEGNAAASAAVEKFGQVPEDIIDGTRRSRFSPPLRTDAGGGSEDSAVIDEDSDDDTEWGVDTMAESEPVVEGASDQEEETA